MKPKKPAVPPLDWRPAMTCKYCHQPLEVATTGPQTVNLRHIGSGLSFHSCEKNRR